MSTTASIIGLGDLIFYIIIIAVVGFILESRRETPIWQKQTLDAVSLKYALIVPFTGVLIKFVLFPSYSGMIDGLSNIVAFSVTSAIYVSLRYYRKVFTGRKELFPIICTVGFGLVGGLAAAIVSYVYVQLKNDSRNSF